MHGAISAGPGRSNLTIIGPNQRLVSLTRSVGDAPDLSQHHLTRPATTSANQVESRAMYGLRRVGAATVLRAECFAEVLASLEWI